MFETAMIRRGELWRFFTSTLLHASILHLIFNVYWFWCFGTLVEEIFGHLRTIALLALFALGSGAFEFALASGGVGLSGVGYGLFAMLWVLSKRDERFREAIDQRTITLFVGWFIFCIATTLIKWFPVGNSAHAAGAMLGTLLGFAISIPRRRFLISVAIAVLLICGLLGSTVARPQINLSAQGGYEEGKWGYDALQAGRNKEAVHWLRDAVVYQPKISAYWFDLGIAYQRVGRTNDARSAYARAQQLEPAKPEYSDAATNLKQ